MFTNTRKSPERSGSQDSVQTSHARSVTAALMAVLLCASARADTYIDADCFKFKTGAPESESPANDFHLFINGQFVGGPSSDAMPNRHPHSVTNQDGTITGVTDFDGGEVANGNSLCVKFISAGDAAPSPSGYFTKGGVPVGDRPVKSKALDGTEVAWMPTTGGGFYATLSLRNAFGVPLAGSVQVVVNSGRGAHYNLSEYDTLRNPRLVLSQPNFTLGPGQGFTNLAAYLASSDDYLLIQGVADAGDGAGGSPFAIAISPLDESCLFILRPGYSTVANNFNVGGNTLDEVLPNPPDGTTLWKYDSSNYYSYQYSSGFGWEPPGGTLAPGEGAFIYSSGSTQSFVLCGERLTAPPQRPRLPAGRYLVSCPMPQPCGFETLMGFPPAVGDQVYEYDGTITNLTDSPSSVHTFGQSGWDVVPVVSPGKSVFVTLVTNPPLNMPLGSTGAFGPFSPSQDVLFNTTAGTFQMGNTVVSGARTTMVYTAHSPLPIRVFDFSDINIPPGITVRARGTLPLVLLAQGQAFINGTIDVSGAAGGNAGRLGGGGGGGGGGAVAIFANNFLAVGPSGQILANGGTGGISLNGGDCLSAGQGGIAGPGGGNGRAGGASVAGGAGGDGGDAALSEADPIFGWQTYLGEGGGGGGGGAYGGPGGAGGKGVANGNPGGPGAAGACPAAVNGGPGGAGGGLPGGVAVGGAGGGGGVAPGGAGLPGVGGAVNAGGGGGGGGATIGGGGAAGGPGAGWGGGGGGGGGADTCPGVAGAPAVGGPGGPGGGGGTAGTPGKPGVVVPPPAPKKEGGGAGGGCIQLGCRQAGQVLNNGLLSAIGGQGQSQQGGLGTIAVFGRLQNDGQVNGTIQESYGQTSDQWLPGGGGGGGGAGGDGQPNIRLSLERSAGALVISWEGGGVLQTASQISGPWIPLSAATSPFTVSIVSGGQFFRVASPCQ